MKTRRKKKRNGTAHNLPTKLTFLMYLSSWRPDGAGPSSAHNSRPPLAHLSDIMRWTAWAMAYTASTVTSTFQRRRNCHYRSLPPGQQHKRDARPLENQEITDKRDKSFLFVVGEFVIAFTFVAFLSGGGGVGVETAFKVLLPELAEPRISAVVGAVISYLIALPRFRLIATTASARSCRFRTKWFEIGVETWMKKEAAGG